MGLTGGKRRVNKSLKSWVAFVKKVQKEENLSYKDAIHRAKVRKDKGEKWMTGGADTPDTDIGKTSDDTTGTPPADTTGKDTDGTNNGQAGGRRRRSRRARSGRRSRRSRSTRRRR
jgi:hypothetical protein